MVTRNRRPFEWYSSRQGAFVTLASGAQTNLLLYNAISLGVRNIKGATITRIIGQLKLRADSLAQNVDLHYGIVVVNADARAAGAFPDPDDLSDRPDWMVRGLLQTVQASLSDSTQWDVAKFDLRAQRILRSEEDELHLILTAGATGFILEWSAFFRVLVRLP